VGSGVVEQDELLAAFEKRTDYAFNNGDLLVQALTHSSQSIGDFRHNERLEFLGDRVLALVIAETLFDRFPEASEGEMALRLNRMVRKETCALLAKEMQLDQLMLSQARVKASKNKELFAGLNVMGDACEAVLAAIYIDSGLEAVRQVILKFWSPMLNENAQVRKDPKSALQEWALGQGFEVPVYKEVDRQGPDHAPVFVMSVSVADAKLQTGTANSKRAAEQEAAAAFLQAGKIEY